MSFFVVNKSENKIVINKSTFISYGFPVLNENEVKDRLEELRKLHSSATHICYAYVADACGAKVKTSDDGEPQGTAGLPILAAVNAEKLKHSLIAVVRYFGGIKLGVGGLFRAYSESAFKAAKIKDECEIYKAYSVKTDYKTQKSFLALCYKALCKVEKIVYNEDVSAVVYAPREMRDELLSFGATEAIETGEQILKV